MALLVFVSTRFLMGITGEKPTEMKVSLEATVLQNDTFQLFYLSKDETSFKEKHSVLAEIKGGDEPQNIEFVVPLDTSIHKLRIDIGNNRHQMPMRISAVHLNVLDRSLSYDISESFIKNVCVSEIQGRFITKMVSNSYDPFFVSNFDFSAAIKDLAKEQPLVDDAMAFFLALIFAVAAFISFFVKTPKTAAPRFQPYIAAFVLIIATPPLVELLNVELESATKEKRELAPPPDWAFNESFPREFEAYYNDNFGLRPTVINWASKLKIGVFRDSPQPELVQFGNNGFLFFNQHNADDGGIYASYSHTNLATDEELEHAYQEQLQLKNDLSKKGIAYAAGFWPNKHSIYGDQLPFTMEMQIQGNTSLADQIVSYFGKRKMNFFDVRRDLLKAKDKKQLYLKFDSHWNSNGAYEAYRSFCSQTDSILGLTPFQIDDFEVTYTQTKKGDLTNLLGIDSISGYHDNVPNYVFKNRTFKQLPPIGFSENTVITENKYCNNKKLALVFRDSYSSALIQFLSLHYYKVIYIWKSPVDMYWVDKIKPDVVILGVVERRLPHVIGTVK